MQESRQGDKRIFLLAGESLGAILRVPYPDEYRANMAVGCTLAKTSLTEKELQICSKIKKLILVDIKSEHFFYTTQVNYPILLKFESTLIHSYSQQ